VRRWPESCGKVGVSSGGTVVGEESGGGMNLSIMRLNP
jgi:hypothetical protein